MGGKGVGCCFVDKNIKPLRLGILWNDARTVPLMEKWIADGTMDEIFAISGNWLMPGDMGLLIPWLAEHEARHAQPYSYDHASNGMAGLQPDG